MNSIRISGKQLVMTVRPEIYFNQSQQEYYFHKLNTFIPENSYLE